MNPDGRSLRSSKIMRMAINRINPNFDRDLRNMSKNNGTNFNRQEAFGKVVKKR
ncbi:hypothetical protein [Vagococcus fluvialis]|uniref:hypothetical protein n=1 Tax=Vagococcus fluvialis TaxID=2738 RepID=UPI001D0A0EED|nr:hypothetical protein [Vagococcus fluvialis]UDM70169.1 hypothetical protein K5L00_08450 [Vagococcus fluvialis]UDM77588.1 hypothetical protein K5K98_03995 [Vagococcus fluvialis]UDM81858.1 hypothetical protein K5K96_10930 [Vagococcus fluvialis]